MVRRLAWSGVLGLGLLFTVSGLRAQIPALDSLITSTMESEHIPGLAAVVVDSGRVVWTGVYGFADVERSKPVTPNTLFMLSSVSKTLTATTLMQLHAAGRFNLDDDVNDHLPFDVRNPKHPDVPITIRQLLRHRSSIQDNSDYYRPFWSTADGDPTIRLGEYLPDYLVSGGAAYDAEKNFLDARPGERRRYCNTCYALLGYLAEVISGRPFQRYAEEAVFEPTCMNETHWFLSEVDTTQVAMPYSYNAERGFVPYGHNGYPDWPAGQLRSNITEMARFLAAYMHGGRIGDRQALDPASIRVLSPPDMSLGFHTWSAGGFFPNGAVGYWHGGGDIGVRTYIGFHPGQQRGLVVLTNGEANLNFLVQEIYEAVDSVEELGPGRPVECTR